MNKYSRHPAIFTTHSDELSKTAVLPKHVDSSLFDTMNAIMNGNQKYTSVAAAVEDMKNRSGLTDYLNKKSQETLKKKTASDENYLLDKKIPMEVKSVEKVKFPKVIEICPQVKQTCENYISDTKGFMSIPAIVQKLKSIHNKDVTDSKLWDDNDLVIYISGLNLKQKANVNVDVTVDHNLGKEHFSDKSDIDPSNTQAFLTLEPAKY